MDKDRRALIEEYKNRKVPMGVLSLKCIKTEESFLEASRDIQADTNSITFKLSQGYHPNRKLLDLWKTYGREGFEITTLEELENVDEIKDINLELGKLRDKYLNLDKKAQKLWL